MINSHLIGRIGQDAQVRQSKDGKKFMTMDVATDFFSKGENKTMWVRVVSNDATIVEKRAQYFKKGTLVTVEGHELESNTWIGKDGNAHAQITIAASFIDFIRIGKRKDANDQPDGGEQPVTVDNASQDVPPTTPDDEDVPF